MKGMISRRLISFIVLSAGFGSFSYGALSHRVPVYEEREVELSIPVASPFAAAFVDPALPSGGPSPSEAEEPEESSPFEPVEEQPDEESPAETMQTPDERSPFETVDERSPFAESEPAEPLEAPPLPFLQSGPMSRTIFERELVSREEPEQVLVREVTFGGLTRLADGQLRRTYSGASPALCPT